MFSSLLKVIRGIMKIRGASDNTLIGNNNDRLKVDAAFSVTSTNISFQTNDLRYDDMNASTGGVARDTVITNASWVDIYSYSGSGYLHAILINLENKNDWQIRFVIDSAEITGSSGILSNDMHSDHIYGLDKEEEQGIVGLGLEAGEHDKIIWQAPNRIPVRFNTDVTIKIKRVSGKSSKKFRAGLVCLIKDL